MGANVKVAVFGNRMNVAGLFGSTVSAFKWERKAA